MALPEPRQGRKAIISPQTMCRFKVAVLEILAYAKGQWVSTDRDYGLIDQSTGEILRGPYRAWVHARALVAFKLAEDGGTESHYRVTKKGVSFLKGIQKVPSKIWVDSLTNVVDRWDTPMVTIDSVEGAKLSKVYWRVYGGTTKRKIINGTPRKRTPAS